MKHLGLAIIGCLAILGGAAAWISYDLYRIGKLPIVYSPLQTACHAAIQLRLRSPSSFRIISSEQNLIPLSLDEAQEELKKSEKAYGSGTPELTALQMALWQNEWAEIEAGNLPGPGRWLIVVDSEASNALGVMVRDNSFCEWFDEKSSFPSDFNLDPKRVSLNGTDYMTWQIKNLRD